MVTFSQTWSGKMGQGVGQACFIENVLVQHGHVAHVVHYVVSMTPG